MALTWALAAALPFMMLGQPSGGDPKCPCLTATDAQLGPLVNASGMPANYGVGCGNWLISTWDSGGYTQGANPQVDQCHTASPPPWCNYQFCYVSYSNCAYQGMSSLRLGKSRVGTWYSSATCGSINNQPIALPATALAGTPLSTVIVQAAPPFSMMTTCGQAGDCQGSLYDFTVDMLGKSGARWTTQQRYIVPLSSSNVLLDVNTAAQYWPSNVVNLMSAQVNTLIRQGFVNHSGTMCVVATALGLIDVCIFDMTITQQRLQYAQFVQIYPGSLFLFVPAPLPPTPSNSLSVSAVFSPFSAGLWILLFIVFGGGAGLLFWHQRDSQSLAPTLGTRITWAGMAFLAFFALAAYSANFSAAMVENAGVIAAPPASSINGIADVIAQGASVCVSSAQRKIVLTSSVAALDPNKVIVSPNMWTSATPGAGQQCKAVVCDTRDWQVSLASAGANSGCGFKQIGDKVAEAAGGVAVSSRVAQTLEYFAALNNLNGLFDAKVKQYLPASQCPAPPAVAPLAPTGLSAGTLLLPIIFAFLILAAGVAVKFLLPNINERPGWGLDGAQSQQQAGLSTEMGSRA